MIFEGNTEIRTAVLFMLENVYFPEKHAVTTK